MITHAEDIKSMAVAIFNTDETISFKNRLSNNQSLELQLEAGKVYESMYNLYLLAKEMES